MNPPDKKPPNPTLQTALGILEGFAPGFLDNPEQACRDLLPRLRFLVVARVEKPTVPQLEAVRAFDHDSNLVQIRKALSAGDLQFGPFPGDMAERMFVPMLTQLGLSVSLRELTEAEKAQQLGKP